jgi:hypothetical protein
MRICASLCLLAAVSVLGCGKEAPTAPSPPACQANNTAQVAFNNARTVTLDVFLGGVRLGTLAPSQTSPFNTVAAGVQHSLEFRVTNTTVTACFGTPVFAQCETRTISCMP